MTTYTLAIDLKKYMSLILITLFVMLVLLYTLLVNMTYMSAARREKLVETNAALSGELADLEFSLVSARSAVSLEMAYARGFKEVKPEYASRKSIGQALTVRNEI
ncbi:MAG: hypothetical protein Q7S15_00740 [bacterium]|nr:hypothetical protein [bacterium]